MDQISKQMVNQLYQMVYDNLKLHLKHRKLLCCEYVPVLKVMEYCFSKFARLLDIFQIIQKILQLK